MLAQQDENYLKQDLTPKMLKTGPDPQLTHCQAARYWDLVEFFREFGDGLVDQGFALLGGDAFAQQLGGSGDG